MNDQRLFDPGPATIAEEPEQLSADARRTLRNRRLIASGIHPATHRRILLEAPNNPTCGDCAHHRAYRNHRGDGNWHKCARHHLGESHSAASDIRVSWPACELFEAEGEQ